jgi:hypothetical protein
MASIRVLIAVPACSKYDYGKYAMGVPRVSENRIEGIRGTWWKDFQDLKTPFEVVHKLFYGQGLQRLPLADEVLLDVADDYTNLPHKMRAIWNWGVENKFDFIYKCDDDTFVYVDRMLKSGFERYDYFGFGDEKDYKGQYISGGSGYWLSSKAAKLVVAAGAPDSTDPNYWAEDYRTGQVMSANNIRMNKDPRFLVSHLNNHYITVEALPEFHDYVSMHACTVAQMEQLYALPKEIQEGVAKGVQIRQHQEIMIRGRMHNPKEVRAKKTIADPSLAVTVVITACNRTDLLERTLDSFAKFNTYPIERYIIVEDGLGQAPSNLPPNTLYLKNVNNLGQVASIDRAYKEVATPYIFHCEEDWEFYRSGFIEQSMKILENYPKIIQVWIRAHSDTNYHPIVKLEQFPFEVMGYDFDKIWHGFSFNPGLRRLSDYKAIGNYSKYTSNKIELASESALSELHKQLGFYAAILPEGYVRHIGERRSTSASSPLASPSSTASLQTSASPHKLSIMIRGRME